MYDTKREIEIAIHRISVSLRRVNDSKLERFGITTQQARLLRIIHRSAQCGQPPSRKQLEDKMQLSGPSVTSLLNGLDRGGFISREAGREDCRAIRIVLTEKGRAFMEQAHTIFDETQEVLLRGLSGAELAALHGLLDRALANIYSAP